MSRFRPMIGHLLLLAIFVDGKDGTSAKFTDDEKSSILRDVYSGAGVLRIIGENWAGVQQPNVRNVFGITVVHKGIQIDIDPAPMEQMSDAEPAEVLRSARDNVWLDAATTKFFQEAQPGTVPPAALEDRYEMIRQSLLAATFFGGAVADAFPVFISKYPVYHLAYAFGGAVVLGFSPTTLSLVHGVADTDNIDGTIAHEIGHVFGAPDEYGIGRKGSIACEAIETAGFFDSQNANCKIITGPTGTTPAVPNPNHQPCLMDQNVHQICDHTARHWGWVDEDHDSVADLASQAVIVHTSFQNTTTGADMRACPPGSVIDIRGRNVWDARFVMFDNEVVTKVERFAPDHIVVRVPTNVNGLVHVSLITRAGFSVEGQDGAAILVTTQPLPLLPNDPTVFFALPRQGREGERVRIVGVNLRDVQSVTFGGLNAVFEEPPETPTLSNRQEVIAVAPPGLTGTVPIEVTTRVGTAAPSFGFADFTYERP